jgi:hypothetical protein
MPTKSGSPRPRAGHGLASDVPSGVLETKRTDSARVARNRPRAKPAKPQAVARRKRRSR